MELPSLKDQIESGEYFRTARRWFVDKYVVPRTQFSFFLVCFIIVTALLILLSLTLYSLFPTSQQVRYVIYTDDVDKNSAKITDLGNASRPVAAVAKIFLELFIQKYETYDSDAIKQNLESIVHMSSPDVLSVYKSKIDINNPNSVAIKYANNLKRSIDIKNVVVKSNNTAQVEFIATLSNKEHQVVETQLCKGIVGFKIDTFDVSSGNAKNRDKAVDYNFIVTSYDIKSEKQ